MTNLKLESSSAKIKGIKLDLQNKSLGILLLKSRTFIALVILLLYFSVFAPNFLSASSFILVTKHVALYAILGVGMTMVIISGGIDLSVGSVVGISGMIAGFFINKGIRLEGSNKTVYLSIGIIIAITLIAGTLIGAVNGILITKFKVAPFIATLGTLYIARGFSMLISNGETFPNLTGKAEYGNTGFDFIGAGTVLKVPIAIWIMIFIAILAIFILKMTPLGGYIFGVGGNEKAALLSGVKVNKVKMFVYMASGFCAAMVGIIVSSQLVAAHPATGESWEMNAIAAAVLGGTSMSGGIGTVGGTILGRICYRGS